MSLSEAIPVRFSPATSRRLKWVSERSGIPVAQLIRIATESYLEEINRSGRITIAVAGGEPGGTEPVEAEAGAAGDHGHRRKPRKKAEGKQPASLANLKAHFSAVEAAKLAADKAREPSS